MKTIKEYMVISKYLVIYQVFSAYILEFIRYR